MSRQDQPNGEQSKPAKRESEVIAVFTDARKLEDAIDALQSSGFDHADLSLLAGEESVADKLGHRYRRVDVEKVGEDPETERRAFVPREDVGNAEGFFVGGLLYVGAVAAAGAVVASGGTLLAALAAAGLAGGAGAGIGGVLAKLIGDKQAEAIQKKLDEGGMLLWIRTPDKAQQERALQIAEQQGAELTHVRPLEEAA